MQRKYDHMTDQQTNKNRSITTYSDFSLLISPSLFLSSDLRSSIAMSSPSTFLTSNTGCSSL